MRVIEPEEVIQAVKRLCIKACCHLPQDVARRISQCRQAEGWPIARDVLEKIEQNHRLAHERKVPICQDTGMACVFLDIGEAVSLSGNWQAMVDEGVRQGYEEGCLRKSVVGDPLRRKNTGDNTPAMLYVRQVPGDQLTITVAPKGFGSENMSRIAMLAPSAGADGVMDFVVDTVEKAGPNPCPPIVVGVGIGGTFDKAATLAKYALLRDIDKPNPDPYYANMEQALLARINKLGIGPQGFGGGTTALAVSVLAMPTHIAGLPCAVNINCHVARHATEVL